MIVRTIEKRAIYASVPEPETTFTRSIFRILLMDNTALRFSSIGVVAKKLTTSARK